MISHEIKNNRRFGLLFIAVSLFFASVYVMASDNLNFDDNPDIPWHISADELEYNQEAKEYIAKGNVTITKGNRKLTADIIRFDHKTMTAVAEGNVTMTSGDDVMTGNRIEIDLKKETGTLFDGSIFIKENHFYIKGDKIQKVGKDEYTAHKAVVSTCDGDNPAWKIIGKNVKVTVEGYGVVSHASFWAKKIPVMYMPMMIFPVKLKRQTGLLPPRFGYSEQNGVEIEQPFYWAINKSSDATFYEDYIQERGDKIGIEYRYVLDKDSKGTLMYNFLNDRKSDNSSRYWFRMKQDQALPFGVSAKIDIDIISDQDYLHEFRDGYTGFDKTEEYFYENFSRKIDDYSDPIRVNSLNLNKRWDNYTLNSGVRWYDNVIIRQSDETDTTLHKLPFLQINSLRQRLSNFLPLYWELDSEYTHFYREEGETGDRIDIYPRISLLKQFGNYLTFEPSVGFRETVWNINNNEDDTYLTKKSSRGIYDIKAELTSNLFKVYQIDEEKTGLMGKDADKIKHIIRPQIIYEYVPDKNQDEYPSFDTIDRIEKKHRITASITNTVISRSVAGSSQRLEPTAGSVVAASSQRLEPSYQPVCRFKLEQSYDISEPGIQDSSFKNHSFSPIYGEIELAPGDFLSVQADAKWSPYDLDFQSRNFSFNLKDKRGDSLFLEYRYNQDLSESFFTDMTARLSERWFAFADYERNLKEGEDIKTSIGILYSSACWSADLSYTNENNDRRYSFMINLKGLGGIGSK